MTVISGMLTAKLDKSDEWVNYPAGTNFEIPANSGFDMKILLISANIYSYKISQHTARLRQNMI
jgi:uncharacterized protein YaiE (UPF0345 family)